MSFSSIYINKTPTNQKTIVVNTNDELKRAVNDEIDRLGYDCSLNHIDVSKITDFSGIFARYGYASNEAYPNNCKFIGDISEWDVSNGTIFENMFFNSDFNGSISKWNMHSAKNCSHMFAYSKFNKDISFWDVSNLTDTRSMFESSAFDKDISIWNMSNACNISRMFSRSEFNKDISDWNIYRCIYDYTFEALKKQPAWFNMVKQNEILYNETYRMKNIYWFTDEYSMITYEQFKMLDSGKHCVYVNYDTYEVVGHKMEDDGWHLAYTFEKPENMSYKEQIDLYTKIKNLDFTRLNCIYGNTFNNFYNSVFVNSFKPFRTQNSKFKLKLFLVNSINWHAKKAGLPCIRRSENNKIEYCKDC